MKILLQLILIVLIFTSCYDESRTLYYKTLNGEDINIYSPDIENYSYSLFKGCYAVELKKGTTILKNFFYNKKDLTSVKIPSCINNIDEFAFEGCDNLQHIELQENIQSIGCRAFKGCRSLLEFKIPPKIKNLESYLFSNCVNLKKVILPEGLESIFAGAFSGCSKLDSIILPKSLTSINNLAFEDCSNLHNITLPSNCINIFNNVFKGCDNLESATIQCNKVGKYFSNLSSLKNITISNPDSISEIAEDAFIGTEWYRNQPDGLLYYNNLLLGYKGDETPDSIIIKEGCNNMPASLFKNRNKIKYVEIPSSIKHIPDSMFLNCDSLECVKMHDGIESIGAYAFSSCAIKELIIPSSVKKIGKGAFIDCCNLHTVELPDVMNNIGEEAFQGCEKIEFIKIPYCTMLIKEATFKGCKNLKEVELSPFVKEIKTLAFAGCENLTKINLHDTIINIGNSAFQECNKLDYKLRANIRTKSTKDGRILYTNLQATTPYIVYLDGDSICCEKYYPSKTTNDVLYKEGKEFAVVRQWLESVNKTLTYKKEKDTLFLQRKLYKENFFCKDKCVAFRTSGADYITDIDSPGVLYEVDLWLDYGDNDELLFNPYIYGRSESLWELPGFYNTLNNYDANACYYFNRGGGIPDFSYTLFLDKKGNIKKAKTLIGIDGKDIPISYIGTSKMTPHYIRVIKDLIARHEPIPQLIPKDISILDLHEQCKNEVKTKELSGTLFAFNVTVQEISYGSSYKYEIICHDEFSEIIAWYGLVADKEWTFVDSKLYSNDDSFGRLSPPCKVRVKGRLDGKWSYLEFVDCELISR